MLAVRLPHSAPVLGFLCLLLRKSSGTSHIYDEPRGSVNIVVHVVVVAVHSSCVPHWPVSGKYVVLLLSGVSAFLHQHLCCALIPLKSVLEQPHPDSSQYNATATMTSLVGCINHWGDFHSLDSPTKTLGILLFKEECRDLHAQIVYFQFTKSLPSLRFCFWDTSILITSELAEGSIAH